MSSESSILVSVAVVALPVLTLGVEFGFRYLERWAFYNRGHVYEKRYSNRLTLKRCLVLAAIHVPAYYVLLPYIGNSGLRAGYQSTGFLFICSLLALFSEVDTRERKIKRRMESSTYQSSKNPKHIAGVNSFLVTILFALWFPINCLVVDLAPIIWWAIMLGVPLALFATEPFTRLLYLAGKSLSDKPPVVSQMPVNSKTSSGLPTNEQRKARRRKPH